MMGRLMGGVSLLVIALPSFAPHSGHTLSPPSVRVTSPSASSPYAGCKVRGPGHSYVSAEVQPQVAVDPRTARHPRPTLLATWAQDPWSNGGTRGLATALSTDGGQSWREREVPFGACARTHSGIARVASPSLAIGPDGIAYLASAGITTTTLSATPSGDAGAAGDSVLVAASRNNGGSWTHVQSLPFNAGAVTKVSVVADPRRRSTAYLAWETDVGSWFSRTTDGGGSWMRPLLIVPGQPILPLSAGNVLVVDPRNSTLSLVYDLLHQLSAPRRYCDTWAGRRGCSTYNLRSGEGFLGSDLMVMSSHDGGRTWSHAHLIARDFGVGRIEPHDNGWTWTSYFRPAAAIDPRTGDIAVAWQDSRFSIGRFDQIALSISDRTGLHWSTPVRVSSADTPAVLPSVAVNARGVTGIAYYQFRGVPAGAKVPAADYQFRAASGPAHLAPARRLAGPLDLGRTGMAFAPFVAHVEGMVSVGSAFWSVFVVPAGKKQQTNVVVARIS